MSSNVPTGQLLPDPSPSGLKKIATPYALSMAPKEITRITNEKSMILIITQYESKQV
jgi:hypothetical protein